MHIRVRMHHTITTVAHTLFDAPRTRFADTWCSSRLTVITVQLALSYAEFDSVRDLLVTVRAVGSFRATVRFFPRGKSLLEFAMENAARRRNGCLAYANVEVKSKHREGETACKSKGEAEPRRVQRDHGTRVPSNWPTRSRGSLVTLHPPCSCPVSRVPCPLSYTPMRLSYPCTFSPLLYFCAILLSVPLIKLYICGNRWAYAVSASGDKVNGNVTSPSFSSPVGICSSAESDSDTYIRSRIPFHSDSRESETALPGHNAKRTTFGFSSFVRDSPATPSTLLIRSQL